MYWPHLQFDRLAIRDVGMIRAYDEIVDFIAAGTTPNDLVCFQVSAATRDKAERLLAKEKDAGLSTEEASELDHYLSKFAVPGPRSTSTDAP